MPHVLLTGGSGFIAAHVLETLLEHGHSIVTTVRSQEKADKIREAHKDIPQNRLDFAIVEDIAKENAFDTAVKADPPFDAVIHTASPFHFRATDIQKEILDPAIVGTTGILKSIVKYAPTVKRVVITSSFAAIFDPFKGARPGYVYSENDWNPVTLEQAVENPYNGYRASKKFAEKAAWDFLKKEKPNFSIAVMNPPLVLGPVVHYMSSLEALNTSNTAIAGFVQGKNKDAIPPSTVFLWVDVRDLALAHVKAIEVEKAENKRFLITAGHFCNKEVVDIIRKKFPEFKTVLPSESAEGGGYPSDGVYNYDNSRAADVLSLKYVSLEDSVVDTVRSIKSLL